MDFPPNTLGRARSSDRSSPSMWPDRAPVTFAWAVNMTGAVSLLKKRRAGARISGEVRRDALRSMGVAALRTLMVAVGIILMLGCEVVR